MSNLYLTANGFIIIFGFSDNEHAHTIASQTKPSLDNVKNHLINKIPKLRNRIERY